MFQKILMVKTLKKFLSNVCFINQYFYFIYKNVQSFIIALTVSKKLTRM
jgi:hypothetical protein